MSSEGSGTGHGCVHRHCDGCAQPLVWLCHHPFFTESSQGRLGTESWFPGLGHRHDGGCATAHGVAVPVQQAY
jgi:hypothetical protein